MSDLNENVEVPQRDDLPVADAAVLALLKAQDQAVAVAALDEQARRLKRRRPMWRRMLRR